MNKRLCESRVVYSERPEARLVVTEIHGIRYRTQGVVSTTRSLATHNFTRGGDVPTFDKTQPSLPPRLV